VDLGGTGPRHFPDSISFFDEPDKLAQAYIRAMREVVAETVSRRGSVEESYRKTGALINRVRHQPAATPARIATIPLIRSFLR
jgi:hypothetical protein